MSSSPETTPEVPDDSTIDPLPATPATPDVDTESTTEGGPDEDSQGPDAAETAPKGGLFDQITGILGGNLVETAKVEALTLAAQGYAWKNKRAVEILEGLDAQTQMELVQKGVTGIELSTFQKILLVVNPGMVIVPETLKALWNGLKRNTLAKVIPDAWINDISWLASQAEVVTMFSTGVVHAKNPEIAKEADQTLAKFLKNTGTAAKVAKMGGALAGQPEIVEGAEMVKTGVEIAKQVVLVFPKVREKLETKRAEVAETQAKEHNEVAADLKPEVSLAPSPAPTQVVANNNEHHDKTAAA